jgi:hypothetical protein
MGGFFRLWRRTVKGRRNTSLDKSRARNDNRSRLMLATYCTLKQKNASQNGIRLRIPRRDQASDYVQPEAHNKPRQ